MQLQARYSFKLEEAQARLLQWPAWKTDFLKGEKNQTKTRPPATKIIVASLSLFFALYNYHLTAFLGCSCTSLKLNSTSVKLKEEVSSKMLPKKKNILKLPLDSFMMENKIRLLCRRLKFLWFQIMNYDFKTNKNSSKTKFNSLWNIW